MSEAQQTDPRLTLAHARTGMAGLRTRLALDRTTLAWVRTSLTMASFGFGMVGFFRSLRASTPTPEAWPLALVLALLLAVLFLAGLGRVAGLRRNSMKAENGSGWMRLAAVAALALATGLPAIAETPDRPTTAMDGQWHFAAAPYFWFSGIKGDVSVRNLPEVPIEKSFSDIWSNLQIGALGHFEGRKDRWGAASDLMYMDLHAPVAASAPLLSQLDAEATVKSFTAEGLGFYRAVSGGHEDNPAFLDVLAGVRYYKMSGQLSVTLPVAGATAGDELVFDWVDAMTGVRFRAPLGSRVALIGRGDVAGFGSKFTWNLEGDLAIALSRHWTTGAGWRHLSIDYDKGTGQDRRVMDVAYDGPRAWFAYAW